MTVPSTGSPPSPRELCDAGCPCLASSVRWDEAEWLRGELCTAERLGEHASDVARAQGEPSRRVTPGPLRARFLAARTRIRAAYSVLTLRAPARRELSPAEEWLLDNSHVVEEQLREIQEDLPAGYLVQLPSLRSGAMAGHPCVYGLCIDYLRHSDARVDLDTLVRYVEGYQEVRRLTIGELWAVPIMLRIGLLLSVGALAVSEVGTPERDVGEEWVEKLFAVESSPEGLHATLASLERSAPEATPPLLVYLSHRLREHDGPFGVAFDWIRAKCAELGVTPEELARREHLRQAADQLSVGNAITSMRAIGALDWNRFFERTSAVEATLRSDPADAYRVTDKASRDRYRHAVEDLARRGRRDEQGVALAAIELARNASKEHVAWSHVGYYLVGGGRRSLEKLVSYRRRVRDHVEQALVRHATQVYLGGGAVATFALVAVMVHGAVADGISSLLYLAAFALAFLLPASEIAFTAANGLVTTLLPPRLLSKLEYEDGIPDEARTLVAVPVLLDSQAGIERMLADLEIRSLANDDENLCFALLTDFIDHVSETHESDDALLLSARNGIAELNRRYRNGVATRYFLLHRRRLHNPSQRCWMGWERKRGKIEELNRLLRGATDTTFTVVTAPASLLSSIKYVITLDADTELPREVARKLVATMAHPLNRPRHDPRTGRVVEGYGIVQPRVGTEPVSARRSRFARLMAGPAGIDPYTTAVSDVYQDLFEEGSYVGKGIYDVDAFRLALDARVPDNLLLSHDLFEGLLSRTALATDIEVLDDQPASYSVVTGRQHRWIRGDWQLLPWVWGRVPERGGDRRENDLPVVARWKLLDNLRRSLVAPALVAVALIGWIGGGASSAVATLTLLAVLLAPVLGRLVTEIARSDTQRSPSILSTLTGGVWTNTLQALLRLAVLLDQAVVSLDAIARSLYRVFVSKSDLLEWRTTSQTERDAARSGVWVDLRQKVGAAAAVAVLGVLALTSRSVLPFAAPLLLLWAVSPVLTRWLSAPLPGRDRSLPIVGADRAYLRRVARKTWHFFETFVTAEDNWLPPDNFQEEPRGVVAHRTSPTNIGLYLLAVAAARDLGFLTLRGMCDRVEATLGTLGRLEKREGHIFNWYDTTTLRPLDPRYVSTVDSGNLVAYLWTVHQTCIEARDAPIVDEQALRALVDALCLSQEGTRTDEAAAWLLELEKARELVTDELAVAHAELSRLRSVAPETATGGPWLERAREELSCRLEELESIAPWLLVLPDAPPSLAVGTSGRLWEEITQSLHRARTPVAIVQAAEEALLRMARLEEPAGPLSADDPYLARLGRSLVASRDECLGVLDRLRRLGLQAGSLADEMKFGFLYDRDRALFSIGYNVGSARLDPSFYDLLASEARLASLVAIAKGEVPQEHWFRMGRPRAAFAGGRALVSWSGSMFEYLMPLLVTKSYESTLLDETCEAIVAVQRAYGAKNAVPWGISESAFNTMDLSMTYQYRGFGVPGLGFKAGLGDDLVVAPYATALAALVDPKLAVDNLRALAKEGLDGVYGYYESIDYTPSHVPPGRRGVIVKTYMAHHQGMTLVALDDALRSSPMQRRFHADARIKATELLLEERVPVAAPLVAPRVSTLVRAGARTDLDLDLVEHVGLAAKGPLRAHLLGHGELSTIVTAEGTGVTTWKGMDVNRFREDFASPPGGLFIYLRDLTSGERWSSGLLPTRRVPDHYDVAFSADRVEIHRRDGDIETLTEIVVSPEHPAEVRRVTLTNHGTTAREIEVTTYMEVVLAARAADVAHRAFSNMFVETQALPDRGALLARRRRRSPEEAETWVVQALASEEGDWGHFEHESSRAQFLGRGRTLENPRAFELPSLEGTSGDVLDPILSLRRRVSIAPGKRARIAVSTGLAASREAAVLLAETFGAGQTISRTFELGWADARVELKHIGMTGAQADRAQKLLSALLFPDPALRHVADPRTMKGRTKDALWGQGISGDLPVLVLRVDDHDFSELCKELILAHELWRLNVFAVDLVLFNEEPTAYDQPVQNELLSIVAASPAQGQLDQRGGVFVRRAEAMSPEARVLFLCAANVVLLSSRGSLGRQLRNAVNIVREMPERAPPRRKTPNRDTDAPRSARREGLLFDNGIGGFSPDGREYVMTIGPTSPTPAPWSNVIASPDWGCSVTESGLGFTWSTNSQSHRMSAWSNDPSLDRSGELLYLRDEEDGSVWSATPLPSGAGATYTVTHGQGYTAFEHTRRGLTHELRVFVDATDPVKICRLRIRNDGPARREISALGVVEWVLGSSRERNRLTTVTELDERGSAILAWNPWSAFPERRAFFATTVTPAGVTGDRDEIFGRQGSRTRPSALDRVGVSGRVGAGLDPGAALLVPLSLSPGETVEVSFVLGEGRDREHVLQLIAAYAVPAKVESSLSSAVRAWDEILGAISVKTPDPALDLLINRWLLYQCTSSRLWGRSAFYQSGGAYGFRDQLQDVLAMLHTRPSITREHILRAAARQFVEGDVQHWWHAESGEGVRTRCSDDMLWLPYVTAEYVRATGDDSVLDERIPFLEERALRPGEADVFAAPSSSRESATLYEHCVRALDAGTTSGPHGLPLMRAGDWNDGMNRIGAGERGESVWLAWFLAKALRDFAPISTRRGDQGRADKCLREAGTLARAVDAHAWDGEWYLRAFFDDGAKVGSSESADCRIDAIAQSWAVIAGGADPARATLALRKSQDLLVRDEDAMLLLFSPAFEGRGEDPGYVQSYPAGIRENGGQYTHGVLWTVLATLLEGRGDEGLELLSMLNPIHHAEDAAGVARYAVEPYVVAADVYAAKAHLGRGGWTWYTGAAGWMYRIAVESLLGLQLDDGRLRLDPCIPASWKQYEVSYLLGHTTHRIVVENPHGVSKGRCRVFVDGKESPDGRLTLAAEGRSHQVRVVMERVADAMVARRAG